ncbi:hypothetical protein CCR75_005826 [Bremia lactucae]|uniref:Uncharacterized protein n=1 Tax=Bremia lactucae TaxID=4779 RepID=A0A976IDY2_BRELC|nr:hypothetical protein CCR75_005826 [Bremia lactucae]
MLDHETIRGQMKRIMLQLSTDVLFHILGLREDVNQVCVVAKDREATLAREQELELHTGTNN